MTPFRYQRAENLDTIGSLLASEPGTKVLGGGTNLVDLMREGIERPTVLIDINRLPLDKIATLPGGGVRIGATARNSDIANHPLIRKRYPLLAKALLSGASPQLRNMATAGGNLMQRTRCYYFLDPGFSSCNKRNPGSGCAALEGQNRMHAIFGATDSCIAVHPSDMCVALAALDAIVQVRSARGERSIPFADFHRLPENAPHIDTTLRPEELIVAIDLPPSGFHNHWEYIKVSDRRSFSFALVSCAAALEMDGPVIRKARISLGGVAHKPWRSLRAEESLMDARASREAFRRAAGLSIDGAKPRAGNSFKVQLVERVTQRALMSAAKLI